jgi:hypothetical protein
MAQTALHEVRQGSVHHVPSKKDFMKAMRVSAGFVAAALLLLAACGDSTGSRPAATVGVLSGSAQAGTIGEALPNPLVVRVSDASGQPVRGATVQWTVTGGGSVTPLSSTSDAAGLAQARWTLGGALGGQVATATVEGVQEPAVFAATAEIGETTLTLTRVSGDGQSGLPLSTLPQPLVVEVRGNGVPVQGATVQWTTYWGATANPATSLTDAQGRASTQHTLGTRSGPQQVDARVDYGNAVVFSTTVLQGPVARVLLPETDSRNGAPMGSLDTAFVVLQDAVGQPVEGVTVSWTVVAGGGTITPTSVSDVNGAAFAAWTMGRADRSQIARAEVAGHAPVLVTLFTALTPPVSGPPAQLQTVSGDGQTTTLAASVREPLVVRVLDAQGRGVGGAQVTWNGTALTADSLGYSRLLATGHRSEPQPVTYTATAEGAGSVSFTVNTTLGPPGRLVAYSDSIVFRSVGGRGFGLPGFVLYDAAGRVAMIGGGNRGDALWSFLDNTGVAAMGGSGNLSFWLEPLREGRDRIEIRRNEGADTVQIIVRQAAVRMYLPGRLILAPGEFGAASLLDANDNRVAGATWTSSNPAVVSVSDFVYTGVAPGTAIVTAEKDGVIFRFGVTVR